MSKLTKLISAGVAAVVSSLVTAQVALAQVDDFYYDYDYSYDNTTELSSGASLGLFLGMMCFYLVAYLVGAYIMFRIAKKAGEEKDAWWAFVPVLNILQMVKISEYPMWYILLFFVPVANIVVYVMIWVKILEKLGMPSWHVVLFFIPGVNFFYMLYLAFS